MRGFEPSLNHTGYANIKTTHYFNISLQLLGIPIAHAHGSTTFRKILHRSIHSNVRHCNIHCTPDGKVARVTPRYQIKSNYFIVRLKVDHRDGQLSLPHLEITETEKNRTKTQNRWASKSGERSRAMRSGRQTGTDEGYDAFTARWNVKFTRPIILRRRGGHSWGAGENPSSPPGNRAWLCPP